MVFKFSQNDQLCYTNKLLRFLLLKAPNSSVFLSQTSFKAKKYININKSHQQPYSSVGSVLCLLPYYYEKHINYSK